MIIFYLNLVKHHPVSPTKPCLVWIQLHIQLEGISEGKKRSWLSLSRVE